MTNAAAPRDIPEAARLTAAWGVHLFTASGAVLGALALVATSAGALDRAALMMLAALLIAGESLSLYGQIGMVLLVGLASKTAILIVEFAKSLRESEEMELREAAIEAARHPAIIAAADEPV